MSRYSFDIQTRLRDRWITEATRETETEARTAATKAFSDLSCAGVRVIRNYHRGEGLVVETEIFCETREVKDTSASRIVEIDEAPPACKSLQEFSSYSSRQIAGRLFRNYLNKIFATPTEIIHSHKELNRIQDKDSLVRSGVDRVAQLQTAKGGGDTKTRREEIFHSISEMTKRASSVYRSDLPKLDGTFSEMAAAIPGDIEQDERDYLALVVLSRYLLEIRNWGGKLEYLCQLTAQETDPHAIEQLDGVIADVLATDVMQDVLGAQASLGSSICQTLDLANGVLPANIDGPNELAEPLNRLFSQRKLPISRRCLVERVHRQLRAPTPLHPRDPAEEINQFRQLMPRLVAPAGLLDGAETADALTTRFARSVVEGGKPGRRAAVRVAFSSMPDPALGVLYLCDLIRCDDGADFMDMIPDLFDIIIQGTAIADLCERMLPAKEKMLRAARAYNAVVASSLPNEIKYNVTQYIDDLLEHYVLSEKIVEKIDRPGAHLRDRARLLVNFCGSGVLPEGKALKRAQDRALALLRQPHFNEHFIEGISNPVQAEKALRDFHKQLQSQPGFMRDAIASRFNDKTM